MTLLLALLACSKSEPAPKGWTIEGALAPALAALDTSHDGKVDADEWAAAAHEGPPFSRVDPDGDGALSTAELAEWMDAIDPLVFDNPKDRRVPDSRASAMIYPRSWLERMAADRWAFSQQLVAAGAANPWPDAQEPPPPVVQPAAAVEEPAAEEPAEGPPGPGRRGMGPGMRPGGGPGMRPGGGPR